MGHLRRRWLHKHRHR